MCVGDGEEGGGEGGRWWWSVCGVREGEEEEGRIVVALTHMRAWSPDVAGMHTKKRCTECALPSDRPTFAATIPMYAGVVVNCPRLGTRSPPQSR